MDPRIGNLWLIETRVVIVIISCCISGVAGNVPDDVVYTDFHKEVRIGDSVVLKCQFRGTPLAVYWKKGVDPIRAPTLVSWITGDPVTGVCVVGRLCQIMEMNAEFSLIIKEVSIAEQGLYLCRVANYKGSQIHNFTDISVFSPPKEPYPIINECQMISPNDIETTCTISTSQSVEISCSASGYFPDIELYFLHGSTSLHTKDTIEVTNLDQTKNKTIYANATANEISYVCFASIPGSQEQRTTTVLVTGPTIPIDRRDGSVAKVVVPVFIVLSIVAVICISIVRWRRRKQQRGQGTYITVLPLGNIDFRGEYNLTDEVLKEYALNITKRHCQRLGDTFRLSADAIATRNEEDLKMFRTDDMLKAWVLDQKCSNYEIRCRLRQAAEQCNRQDIADDFISKEESEVMTSPMKLQACVTVTNEDQSPGASRSENVSSISCDELDRIGRYAGSAVLCSFCKKYNVPEDVPEVPEQQSPEGKELLFETKLINVLKPTLDSEHERITTEKKPNTPRETLRQLLESEHPRYACLLPMRKPCNIFNVELIDLAFRLIMADVYPFAKALNISDQVLTHYRGNLGPHNLTQGTAKIMQQGNTDNRVKMVMPLRQAGYAEEARALYFGYGISVRDVIEVENRVDKAQLAKKLDVSDDVQSTGPDNQEKDDTLHQSVLLRWRDTVCSSTFNHRLVLADALFSMEEEQLALDIISGAYRSRVIDEQVAQLLLANILMGQLTTLFEILDQTEKNEEKGLKRKGPTEMSNKLLDAGFYAHAHEIMAGGPSRLLESQTKPPSADSQTKPLSPELVERCAKDFSTVSEMEFLKLAQDIPPSYYKAVGISLGFSYAQLLAILVENFKNYTNALLDVFMKWNVKQQPPHSKKRQLLADKLREIDLCGLSDGLLNEPPIPNSTGGPARLLKSQTKPPSAEFQTKPLSPELVERCANDLKLKYRSTVCKIRADPLNLASVVGFKDMHLFLQEEYGKEKRKLDYNDILDLKVNGEFPKRIMVQGEAGAGKTTFCAKIAWDWIEGRHFSHFVWVLVVPLREFKQHTIGEIAKSYLAKSNPATVSQITEYIRSNPDKVFIAFDGLDEVRGKMMKMSHQSQPIDQIQLQPSQPSVTSSEACSSSETGDIGLVDILCSDQLASCPVLVTTRPWRAVEIRSDGDLMKLYTFIHVEGFYASVTK